MKNSFTKRLDETESTYISVGHRMSLLRYHEYVLELKGDQKWRLVPTKDYQAEMSLLAP